MNKKDVLLRARNRELRGKNASHRLRMRGLVPAVMYGHGQESRPLVVEERELTQLLSRISVDNTLVDLEVEGGVAQKVLIREVQRHPWRSNVLHVDFFRIQADEEIRVAVPLRLVGVPAGVRNSGGILQQNRYEVEVECLPSDIPEHFELDVSELDIGDSLHLSDIQTGGVLPLDDPELTVCTVVPPTVMKAEEEAEEEAVLEELEPEVIGRAKEGEPAEEDEGEGND